LRDIKKNKRGIFSFVISVAIIAVIFSPYPGVDSVSIITSNADLIAGTDSTLSPTISTLTPSSSTLTTTDSTFQDIPAKTSSTLSPTSSTPTPSSSTLTTSSNTGALTSSTNPPPTTSTVTGSDEVFTPTVGMTTSTNPPPTTSTVTGSDEVFTPTVGMTTSTNPPPTTSTVFGTSTPDCSSATPSIDTISPRNNKLVDISIIGITDLDGDTIIITINAITQDEPTSITTKGKKSPDGFGIGTNTAQVRAESSSLGHGLAYGISFPPDVGYGLAYGISFPPDVGYGLAYGISFPADVGDGRVYEISFSADDGNGGICSGKVSVGVPITKKGVAIDSGQNFDSTQP